MAEWYKEITGLGQAVIKKTRLSNAMGTPLALVVLVTLPSLLIYAFTKFWPLVALAALPALYFIRAFDYIMKHHPGMLRTEEHEERMLQIAAGLGEKGNEITEAALDKLKPTQAPKSLGEPKKEGGNE